MILKTTDNGSGPVLVLVHGFPLDHTMWHEQSRGLASTFRVIVPDLRGHGRSDAAEGVATIDAMGDDILETLDSMNIHEPVALAGMSMGGYIALSLAKRHADRLRALILVNTRAGADTPETARVREDLAQIVEREGTPAAVVSTMLAKLFSAKTRAEKPELMEQTKARMSANPARGVASALRGMAVRPDRTADLAGIGIPTLVVVGRDDELIPVAESQKLATAIPGAKLVEIADAGHMAPLENPKAVNEVITSFLKDLP